MLYASAPVVAAAAPSTTINIAGPLAGMIVSFLGLWIFRQWGRNINILAKWDDVLRVLFGASMGVAATSIPVIKTLSEKFSAAITSAAHATGWPFLETASAYVVGIILGLIGLWRFYREDSNKNLLWMLFLGVPLFGLEAVQGPVNFVFGNILIPGFHGIMAFFQSLFS